MKLAWKRWFLTGLALWLVLMTSLVTVAVWPQPVHRAVLIMGWGLIILWIAGCGSLMYGFRDSIRAAGLKIPLDWRIKFFLGATLLAMIEEVITTSMTNLAPLLGVEVGKAYITASTNYLDVICFHSVVMFIPLFVGWTWILSRYRFSPFAVFLLFGLTGTMAEATFGPQHLMEFALWIYVYGLMVYLPAYCVPSDRTAREVRWWHYPLAVIVPFLFEVLVPTGLLIKLISPDHPQIHFPPIH
jgi:hypothetical protein